MAEDSRPRETPSAQVRHGRQRHSGPASTLLKWVGVAAAVVIVSAASVTAYAVWDVSTSFKPSVELHHAPGQKVPEIGALEGGVNFLLAGDDSGDGNPAYGHRQEKLNDVTILIHLSSDHQNATIVTFPRDMFVSIPQCPKPGGGHYGTSTLQMNNAYAYGGLPCVVKTVEDLTGLTVSYAADIGFDGAVAVSNVVGGVQVCVSQPIRDPHSALDIPAGMRTISGAQAVAFLRTRYAIGDGSDLGRISNQQLFFSALVRQTRDQLSNLPKVYEIAKTAAAHMTLSSNLQNVNTLVSIGLAFKSIDFDKVVFVQYPNHYESAPGGAERVFPTEDAAAVLNAALGADQPVVLTGKTSGTGATKLDPNAAPAPTSSAPTRSATADAGTSAPDTSVPPSSPAVDLPDTVYGQTAAQQTCTVGFGK